LGRRPGQAVGWLAHVSHSSPIGAQAAAAVVESVEQTKAQVQGEPETEDAQAATVQALRQAV
jgi:hypothetical protein